MKQSYQKRLGINPDEIGCKDFKMNFSPNDDARSKLELYDKMSADSWQRFIVVNRKGPIFLVEHTIYVFLTLISPYIYAWYTVFGTPPSDEIWFKAMFVFEVFFLFNIIFTFFVEYNVEG